MIGASDRASRVRYRNSALEIVTETKETIIGYGAQVDIPLRNDRAGVETVGNQTPFIKVDSTPFGLLA
jgi:hypothetical protein